MITGYIIIGIIAFLVLILISPVYITVTYDDDFYFKIRFWCFTFKCMTSDNIQESDDKKSSSKKQKNLSFWDTLKKYDILNSAVMLKRVLLIIFKNIKKFIFHVKVDYLDVNYVIVGNDAADTALKYGYISSLSHPLKAIFIEKKILKDPKINILAGFNYDESDFNLRLKGHVKIVYILICLASVSLNVMKSFVYLKFKGKKI